MPQEKETPTTQTPQPVQPVVSPTGQPLPPQQLAGHPAGYVENPGQTLGIVGIVLNAVGVNIGGIILGVMSRNKSKEVGMSTTLGVVSLVWGIVGTVLGLLAIVFWVLIMMFGFMSGTLRDSDYYTTPVDEQSTYSTPTYEQ